MYGEIIEYYPLDENNTSDKSIPSCLILHVNLDNGDALHVVAGYNGKKIIFITAYHPDKEHWEDDYKTRKVN